MKEPESRWPHAVQEYNKKKKTRTLLKILLFTAFFIIGFAIGTLIWNTIFP